MGYNFIYLLCVLVLFMLAFRLFRKLFSSHRRHQTYEDDDRSYYESIYEEDSKQNEDVIDVDYKVVDEQENPRQ